MTGGTESIGNHIYYFLIPDQGGYDPVGNLTSVTDSVTGAWNYSYDKLNRLTSGAAKAGYYSGAAMSWTYDAFGNRLAQTVGGTPKVSMPSTTTASYTTASNQVSSVNGGAGLAYDAAGDVIQDSLNSYLYDAESRLCAVKNSNNTITEYVYDAAGTRVAKGTLNAWPASCVPPTSANGFKLTTSWVLGPGGEQVTEYAVSGAAGSYTSTWVHTNAFSGGKIQATYAWSNSAHTTTDTYFYLGDWLGTKRAEVSAGGCLSTFTSLAYGDDLPTALTGTCYVDATEHHFTGKERDAESGNDYFGARYYASSMGRFMSPDWSAKEDPVPYAQLDDPQSLNLYAYVRNNPMVRIDADGHWTMEQVKTGLDVASFIPVVGDFASAASGGISLAQGHYGEAALSFAAAVPVVGMLAEGGKAAKLIGEAGKALHAEKEIAATAHAAEEGSTLFRRGAHDTQGLLTSQASAAEKAGLPHGVSVSTSSAAKPGQVVRSASSSSVESAGLNVHKTGSDPNHFTVELPKPITKAITEKWNALFK
jgi:RHS repeat-associated protein